MQFLLQKFYIQKYWHAMVHLATFWLTVAQTFYQVSYMLYAIFLALNGGIRHRTIHNQTAVASALIVLLINLFEQWLMNHKKIGH